jgi:hypothetical protein
MSADSVALPLPRRDAYVGPPPAVPAIALTVTFLAGVVLGASNGGFATPDTPAAEMAADVSAQPAVLRWVAVLQVGSALALGVFTAAITGVLESRGVRVAGVAVARFGGTAAAVLLALSALCSWCVAQLAGSADPGTVKALALLGFATGGPGQVAVLGLLMAGVSIPTMLGRLVPTWVSVSGLVLAGVALVAVLSLAVDQLQALLPLARFPGFLWAIAVALTIRWP